MQRAGRLDDIAFIEADSHGNSCCSHAAAGPAVTGSNNILINNRPALRVSDAGRHSQCCGHNSWVAVRGARHVLFNGTPAHRTADDTRHCGGMGTLVCGSPDVQVGDFDKSAKKHAGVRASAGFSVREVPLDPSVLRRRRARNKTT